MVNKLIIVCLLFAIFSPIHVYAQTPTWDPTIFPTLFPATPTNTMYIEISESSQLSYGIYSLASVFYYFSLIGIAYMGFRIGFLPFTL